MFTCLHINTKTVLKRCYYAILYEVRFFWLFMEFKFKRGYVGVWNITSSESWQKRNSLNISHAVHEGSSLRCPLLNLKTKTWTQWQINETNHLVHFFTTCSRGTCPVQTLLLSWPNSKTEAPSKAMLKLQIQSRILKSLINSRTSLSLVEGGHRSKVVCVTGVLLDTKRSTRNTNSIWDYDNEIKRVGS